MGTKRFTQLLIFAALLTAVTKPVKADPQTHIVEVGEFYFSPDTLYAALGDTVRWVLDTNAIHPHTTTSEVVPTGADHWDSPISQQNTEFEYVLTELGEYLYFCEPHKANQQGVIYVTEDGEVSVAEIEAPATFNMYPNPASDFIQLELSEVHQFGFNIRISDLSGRVLLAHDETLNGGHQVRIPVEHLKKGTYLLTAESKEAYFSKLLILE
jgi:plastocyanin